MKDHIIYICLLLAGLFTSCSKTPVYETSESENSIYSKVYMPRADRSTTISAISTEGSDQVFTYNAYLGGPITYNNPINISFSIDEQKVTAYNTANGTDYQLLPATNFTLEATTGAIMAGDRATPDYKLTIKPGSQLEMFKGYLLPLSIQSVDGSASVNEKLSTTYFIFNVTYQTGQVPREKVLSLGDNWGNLLSNGARGSLIRRNTNNDILLYTPDETGRFTIAPRTILRGWADTESFYYVNEKSIVVRNYPYFAGLFNFIIDDDHNLFGAQNFWLGDFWDKYTLIPFKNYFLTINAAGIMYRQTTLTDINAPKMQIGAGFTGLKQILALTDYLIAVSEDGKLWLYSMSAEGVPGSRRQVGQGWDMYKKIIVSGSDILALDNAGDVYRYKFNPKGFYPLK